MVEAAKRQLQMQSNFSLDETLQRLERSYVEAALSLTNGNLSQAAKLLGVHRTTLYSRMQNYGTATAPAAVDSERELMYYAFFGLTQPPFKITPDTDFFFEGGNRGAVLEALIYAISQGEGIIKVTGEVGSGKTMLCRVLQARLPQIGRDGLSRQPQRLARGDPACHRFRAAAADRPRVPGAWWSCTRSTNTCFGAMRKDARW